MSVTTSEAVRRALASAAAAGEAGAGAGAGGQGGEQLAQQDQEGAEGAAVEGGSANAPGTMLHLEREARDWSTYNEYSYRIIRAKRVSN